MNILIFLAMMSGGFYATATTYSLVPDNATLSDCRALGMTGEFVIRRNNKYENPRARNLVFLKSKKELIVYQSRQDKDRYTAVVRCSYGCIGAKELFLDLNLRKYEYKNDIWFPETGKGNDDLCRGDIR